MASGRSRNRNRRRRGAAESQLRMDILEVFRLAEHRLISTTPANGYVLREAMRISLDPPSFATAHTPSQDPAEPDTCEPE